MTSIPRRVAFMLLAMGTTLSITVSAGSAAADPPTTSAVTNVETLSPVDPAGHLAAGYTIAKRYQDANCESGSLTVGKAYECFTPQSPAGIYDSCWVQANHTLVVCLLEPWMRKAVQLRVSRGYGDSSGFSTVTKPWGVRLGASTRCGVILGPVHSIHGKPRTYLCNHRTVLAGKPAHHGSTWRVRSYREVHRKGHPMSYRSLGVQTATVVWFGKPSLRD